MSYLLDTHVLLWWLEDNKILSKKTKAIIANPDNTVFVSAVSTWEITIKKSLGKLESPDNFEKALEICGFDQLPISISHTTYIDKLEKIHDDPFDKLLIAQTICENLTLITKDKKILNYKISLLEA